MKKQNKKHQIKHPAKSSSIAKKPLQSKTSKSTNATRTAPATPPKTAKGKQATTTRKKPSAAVKKEFPNTYPFWARFRKNKNRTTLVIDDDKTIDKKTKKEEEAFVHREATHTARKDYEEVKPNPDKTDKRNMFLKRPTKKPKRMFEPHNKDLYMPAELKKRYSKNNKKDK